MARGGGGQPGSDLPVPAPGQVTILAQLIAGPGRADPVRDTLLQLVGPTREEPGNISYDVHRLKNNPAAFYVLGNWTDKSALEAHLASTHVRSYLTEQAARELVAPYTLWRAHLLSEPETNPDRPLPVADSPAQVTLVPFFATKPGEETPVGRAHLEMVGLTRAEPGCLGYDLYRSMDDPRSPAGPCGPPLPTPQVPPPCPTGGSPHPAASCPGSPALGGSPRSSSNGARVDPDQARAAVGNPTPVSRSASVHSRALVASSRMRALSLATFVGPVSSRNPLGP